MHQQVHALSASSPKYTTQRDLQNVLYELFPGKDIFQNTRRKSSIVSPITGYFLELDFWIPSLKLAFEFQDPHHYISLGYSNAPLEDIQQRDNIKKWQIKERGESLVIVPYWWDGKADSLIASIRLQRGDLFPSSNAIPIPDEPPEDTFKPKSIPGVGQLMLASFTDTSAKFDPTKWWIGEKYDGVRVCWSPGNKLLYSRFGSEIYMPKQFVVLFPRMFLDGEIWFGRDSVTEAQTLARKSDNNDPNEHEEISWNFLRVAVFDCPDKCEDGDYIFEKAHSRILQFVPEDHSFMTPIPYMACRSKNHAKRMAQLILRDSGEGIMLREPNSPYQHGRANSLVKIKFRDDQEGLVIDVGDEECTLRLKDGITFPVPLPTKEKRKKGKEKVQVGDVVTFSYSKFSAKSGFPVEPKLLMIRNDVTWADVLVGDGRLKEDLEEFSAPKEGKRAPYGHWTQTDGENVRTFFENFAKSKNFDPLVPENWYALTTEDVMNHNGTTILKHYGGSVAKLLMDVFPNIGLDLSKFENKPHGYWVEPLNRRKFFEKIAKKKGLDSLIPETWYTFPYESVVNEKGGSAVVKYHNYSLANAISELFPEINADKKKFPVILRNHWGELANRKAFFDSFAAKKGFDALVPENWYSFTLEDIFTEKKGRTVLKQQKGSVSKTLMEVYPNIGFDERKFNIMTQGYWNDPKNKRKFFDNIAAKNGFDPLKPENWYSLKFSSVLSEKSGLTIMKIYNFSIVLALQHVYPEIGLETSKFSSSSRKFWSVQNRRSYFDEFARKMKFDPKVPQNWYSIPESTFTENKALKTIVSLCYNYSFPEAIADLYPDIGLEKSKFNFGHKRKRRRLVSQT